MTNLSSLTSLAARVISDAKYKLKDVVDSPKYAGFLFLGFGLSVTFVSTLLVGSNSLTWASGENKIALEKIKESVGAKLQVEVAHLAALQGLYDASNEVEEQEFASFMNSVFEGSNGLKGRNGLGFIVNRLNDVQLTRVKDDNDGDTSVEASIEYIHPLNWRNRYLKSLNISHLDGIAQAMRETALNNTFKVTSNIALGEATLPVQFTKIRQDTRFLLHPVYKKDFISTLSRVPSEGQSSVDGWVFSNFDLSDFINQAISKVSLDNTVGLCIKQDSEIILGSCQHYQSAFFGFSPLVSRDSINFGGQQLSLSLQHNNAAILGGRGFASNFTHLSFYILFAGAFASVVGAYVVSFFSESHVRTKLALSESQRLLDEQMLAATVFEASSNGIVICDCDNRIKRVNAAFSGLTGFNSIELIGKNPNILGSGRHSLSFFEDMFLRLGSTGFWSGNIWNKTKSNELALHSVSINVVFSEKEEKTPLYYVATYQDITEQDRVGREALHRATHDPLTGFLNKKAFIDGLSRQVSLCERHGNMLSVFFLDLDSFKPVNDTYGHEAGDFVLKIVAQRLQSLFRESDLLARVGGDEFILAALNIASSTDSHLLAERIKAIISEPIDGVINNENSSSSDNLSLSIGASVGVAVFPDHGGSVEDLIEYADQQMYLDKRKSSS